jgi:hypothetical protein
LIFLERSPFRIVVNSDNFTTDFVPECLISIARQPLPKPNSPNIYSFRNRMQFELFSEVKLTKDLPEDNLLKGMTVIVTNEDNP